MRKIKKELINTIIHMCVCHFHFAITSLQHHFEDERYEMSLV